MTGPQPPTKRRWLAYSLRSLLILITVVAVWLGIKTTQARRQKAAVAAIEASGGMVRYNFQEPPPGGRPPGEQPAVDPPGPKWLRDLIGDEFFQDVVEVSWAHNAEITTDDLRWLADFPMLDKLNLNNTNVDDAGLEQIAERTSLTHVLLENCKTMTDRGLAHVGKLPNLESLRLMNTRCSDEGVRQHVPHLLRLKYLDVSGIPVSNETAQEFRHLKSLTMLHLSRVGQRATHDLSEAVELLKKELPGSRINYWPPQEAGGE